MRPMMPAAGPLPTGPEWTYEVDWAGVRLLADVDEGVLTLRTTDGRDVTARFPEFAAWEKVVADGLFDGEAVMLDAGTPSVLALSHRLRVTDQRRARTLAKARPAVFMVHDVLRLYGVPLEERSWSQRRAVLRRLDLAASERIQLSPSYDDGAALLAGVSAQGLSGVVAKRRDQSYDPETPTPWVRTPPTAPPAGVTPAGVTPAGVPTAAVPRRPVRELTPSPRVR